MGNNEPDDETSADSQQESEQQPADSDQGAGQCAASESAQQSDLVTIDAAEFPAITRAYRFRDDIDGYLRDLGIDPSGLDSDNAADASG